MTRNFDHEFDQIFEMEAEEFAYAIVKNGKKTLLRLGLNIEDKIENYLKENGILKDLEDLNEQVEELEKLKEQLDELKEKLEELEENGFGQKLQILVLVDNGATVKVTGPDFSETLTSSGGQALFLPETLGVYTIVSYLSGKTSTKTITATENTTYSVTVDFQSATIIVKGYGGMVVSWTSPDGATTSFTFSSEDAFGEQTLTVEELGLYRFIGSFGSGALQRNLNVEYFNVTYEAELYMYEKKKLSDCTWGEIQDYASQGVAPYVFDLGDTIDISTGDGIRTMYLADFDYEPFTTTTGTPQKMVFATRHLGYTILDRQTLDDVGMTETYNFNYSSSNYKKHFDRLKDGFPSDLKAVLSTVKIDGSIGGVSKQINTFTGTCAVGNQSFIADVFPPPVYAIRKTNTNVSNATTSTVRASLATFYQELLIPMNGTASSFGAYHTNSAYGSTTDTLTSNGYHFEMWGWFAIYSETHTAVRNTKSVSISGQGDLADAGKGYDIFCFCIS